MNVLTLFWLSSAVFLYVFFFIVTVTTNVGFLGIFSRIIIFFGKLKKSGVSGSGNGTNSRSNVKGQLDEKSGQETTNTTTQKLDITRLNRIPKRYFFHFYAFGALVNSVVFVNLIALLLGSPLPYTIRNLIRWINLGNDQSGLNNNAWPVLITLFLEFMQILRRLYECLFISVYSEGTINIFHYSFGIFLYGSYGIGLLSSMDFEKLVFPYPSHTEILCYFLAVSVFSWGFYYQYMSMHTFASLRKKQKDDRPDDYYIPQGHLFEWVSCPHYLCEMLIYLAPCIIFQFSNYYILSLAAFVWTNQIICSVLAHKWYQQHFPNYPKLRTAVIPYIL